MTVLALFVIGVLSLLAARAVHTHRRRTVIRRLTLVCGTSVQRRLMARARVL
jgi:hypothetical protein